MTHETNGGTWHNDQGFQMQLKVMDLIKLLYEPLAALRVPPDPPPASPAELYKDMLFFIFW